MAQSSATVYQVTIELSASTVQQLQAGNFSLCALKAIATTAGGGQPTLWLVTQNYSKTTMIEWQPAYQAYVSQSTGVVLIATTTPIDYGQIMSIAEGKVTGGGVADGMSILNNTTAQYTSGLAAAPGGGNPTPMAAFPLFGNMMNAFAPVEEILLMFTNYPATAGAGLTRAYAEALLIDMEGATPRTVSFDINSGWSWGGGAWAQTIQPNALLAPVLIDVTDL